MINNVINQVIILLIMMIVGFYARKRNFINEEVNKGLSNILMNITLPLLIFTSFNFKFSKDMILNGKLIFIYSLIIHIILLILSKVFFYKYENKTKNILRFITTFSNCGFMGYPVLEGLYGKVGVFYASIFGIPFNIFLLSFGIMLFTEKKDFKTFKNVLTHPGIIAVFLGLIMFKFSIKLPIQINEAINMVANMTTPLSMIIIGAMLAEANIKDVFSGFTVYYLSIIRLIVAPIITFIVLKIMHVDDLILQICVILEAMPGAVIAGVFAEKYNGNKKLASKGVFITTILSIVTIPIIVMIL